MYCFGLYNERGDVIEGLVEEKKEKTRKSKKRDDSYTFWDFILDVLFWIPELILFPFRLIFWSLRGIGRLVSDLFDIV
ncbi:hypothetical protein [Paracerasibacillus soli]|uniref:Uncharacterized protein n=1 Tax=Paracerasibacillus soli TaxID=480284 RepID=A0ABU5CM92_9BACI|nr:hypothetical protein [Virgibacillus soli]MDY0407461.1 hypothetical protein [Virgibacillus soli]